MKKFEKSKKNFHTFFKSYMLSEVKLNDFEAITR